MHPLALLVYWLIRLLLLLLVVNALMSWFNPNPRHGWQALVARIVEPLLHPIRTLIPPTGGMDFSPMIAAVLLWLLQSLLLGSFS